MDSTNKYPNPIWICPLVLIGLFILYVVTGSGHSAVITTSLGQVYLDVEESKDHGLGLMNRPSLGLNNAMLFAFEEEAPRGIWMKSMLFPIDIIFVSEFNEIRHIEKNAPPCIQEPCPVYSHPAKYILEVNAGFCEANSIQIGNKVKLR